MILHSDTGPVHAEETAIGRRPASRTPRVTIGLPLYNAEQYLEGCLACIERQTFKDFVAFAIDNASQDATPDILRKYTEKDNRFVSSRNRVTKSAMDNFIDILQSVKTEYFLWRAYDDFTSNNFLEEMVKLLDANPEAELAVSKIVSLKPHKNRRRVHRYPIRLPALSVVDLPLLMFRSHASWFYCLWRTQAIRRLMDETLKEYHSIWGHDHLVLFDVMVRGKVVGANSAEFFQRVVSAPYKAAPEGEGEIRQKIARMERLREEFRSRCNRQIEASALGAATKAVLRCILPRYVSKRVFSEAKLRRMERQVGRSKRA